VIRRAIPALLAMLLLPARARAQVEYYDLEAGRPLRVQDAYAIERYGWDVQVGPGVSSPSSSSSSYLLEAALAYGAFARTQFEITAPLVSTPAAGGGRSTGLAGLGFGVLYNLNAETISLPALALAAQLTTTAGSEAPPSSLLSLEGIATRSWPGVRVHLNAAAAIGPEQLAGVSAERSRWFAGVAADHAWPISSLLAVAEIVVERPLGAGSSVAWSAGAGARWQAKPRLVLDAAISRRFSGDDLAWMATAGVTWSFAVRALMPVRP